jgi:hypothetical protein
VNLDVNLNMNMNANVFNSKLLQRVAGADELPRSSDTKPARLSTQPGTSVLPSVPGGTHVHPSRLSTSTSMVGFRFKFKSTSRSTSSLNREVA